MKAFHAAAHALSAVTLWTLGAACDPGEAAEDEEPIDLDVQITSSDPTTGLEGTFDLNGDRVAFVSRRSDAGIAATVTGADGRVVSESLLQPDDTFTARIGELVIDDTEDASILLDAAASAEGVVVLALGTALGEVQDDPALTQVADELALLQDLAGLLEDPLEQLSPEDPVVYLSGSCGRYRSLTADQCVPNYRLVDRAQRVCRGFRRRTRMNPHSFWDGSGCRNNFSRGITFRCCLPR